MAWIDDLVSRAQEQFETAHSARAYIAKRGIPINVAQAAGVGYLAGWTHSGPQDFLRWATAALHERLIFPLTTADGVCIGIQTRSISSTDKRDRYLMYRLPGYKGIEPPLFHTVHAAPLIYGHHQWKQLIVVEGVFDALAVKATGENAVIATLTASISSATCTWLQRWSQGILALLDMDEAGRRGVDTLLATPRLLVSAPHYPAHDPADLWYTRPQILSSLVHPPMTALDHLLKDLQ